MLLKNHIENNYDSRKDAAKALGVSYEQLNNCVHRGAQVIQLFNGKWMILSRRAMIFDR